MICPHRGAVRIQKLPILVPGGRTPFVRKQEVARRPLVRREFLCRASQTGEETAVSVFLAPAPQNSRLLCAGVDIQAPVESVWNCLTDYEHLAEFIPGLVVNECLERRDTGARLKQVGQQDLYLGVKFCATAVLDIVEHIQGMPQEQCYCIGYNHNGEFKEGDWFPCPEKTFKSEPRDIVFSLVDGDFQAFKGVWRMERMGPGNTRLAYGLHVRPQRWLPVGLIQGRIKREVQSNLVAVKRHAEGTRS